MKNNNLLDIDILDICYLSRQKQSIVTKSKSCFVLSCRLQGESLFIYNNKSLTAKRGDVLYIPVNSDYSQSCESEEVIAIHFQTTGQVPKKLRIYQTKQPDEICEYFRTAYKHWKSKAHNSIYLYMAELYKIIAFSNILSIEKENMANRLSPAIDYINSHIYDTDLSLDKACSKAAISRVYFNKLFKEQFHLTPNKYINKLRIKRATTLLKNNICTNNEIATQCGFNDVKYFYTVFKNITGKTTKEYLQK